MASIADLFFLFHGDDSQLQLDATKAGETAGQKAGQSFNSTFGARLKQAAGGLIGAGIGAAVGMVLSGANQLDAATRQLQADTGMTATEAAKAEQALAGMYQHNLQGFDAIGAAMSKVYTDLHLTGAAADATTQKFLKFSTATGQEAAGAVSSFREILDAWNLTAADAGGLMDKLIVSHQKFGGVITDFQSSLHLMAPAMQAANMTIDDGIALLNLFNTAGIDASKAPMALNHAVKMLQPGQGLNDLITQISSIVDPTLRAQEAMRIFGARGGTQMAQAFKPGMTSLDAYKILMDDVTGATDKASAAVESGFGAQFSLLLHKAGGALAAFGTQFGPLLILASAFGPQMIKLVGAGLGGLAGLIIPRVTAAVVATGVPAAVAGTGVGTMIGTAMGAAIPIAMAVGLGALIGGAIGMAIEGPVVDKAKTDMAKAVSDALAKSVTIEDLQTIRASIQNGLDRMNSGEGTLFGWDIFGGKAALQTQLDAVDAKIAATASKIPETVATALKQGAPKVEIAVKDLVKTFGTTLGGVIGASHATGAEGMLAMAAGIAAARQAPLSAFDALKTMLKNAMSPMAEFARLHGELTSKALAAGLRSGDPEVRAQALAVRDAIYARLGELAAGGGKAGKAAMDHLDAGIRSTIPEVHDAALAAKNAALGALAAAAGPAGAAGAAAGTAFAKSLTGTANDRLSTWTWKMPDGTVTTYGATHGHAAGVWDVPANEVAVLHAREMVVPAAASEAIRAGRTSLTAQGLAGRSAGAQTTVNVYNPTPEPASTSTKRELQKLAAFGVLG